MNNEKRIESRKMKVLTVVIALLIVIAFMPAFAAEGTNKAKAAEEEHIVFDKDYPVMTDMIMSDDEDGSIVYAKSSDPETARVKIYKGDDFATVYGLKAGTAYIYARDDMGNEKTVKVEVRSNYFYAVLKNSTELISPAVRKSEDNMVVLYGDKYLNVRSNPGAKIKFTLGGQTSKAAADADGNAKIKGLKNVKAGTAYTAVITWNGAVFKKTGKVAKYTMINSAKAGKCRKTVTVSAYNIHKGDRIKVKYGKKTYKKTIKKDKLNGKYRIKISKRYKKGRKIKVVIFNKFGQKMDSRSIRAK